MTHRLSDKPSVVTVPFRQVVAKAGEIGSTVEDTSTWVPLENGLNIKDGKLALSTSNETVVINAQTLYPQLWANSPASWQSGSDLVVPATGVQSITEWIDATAEMNLDAKAPTGTGLGVTQNSFSYYRYRGNGKSIDIEFRWSTTTSGSTGNTIKFLIPDGLEFGFSGLDIQSTPQTMAGVATTYKLKHDLFVDTDFITAGVIADTLGVSIVNLGESSSLKGQDIIAAAQLYLKANIKIDQELSGQTPFIHLFDDLATNVIGLPDATAESKGLTSLNQVAEAGRNYIINGGMEIDQRNDTSISSSNRYTLDRWLVNASGANVQTQQLDDGSNEEFSSFMRIIATTADNNWGPQQRIESVKTLSGKKATLSFEIRSNDSSVSNINIALRQIFGTGSNSPSSPGPLISEVISITNIFTRHEITFDIPDIGSSVIGNDNNDYLAVFVEQPDIASGQFDLRRVKLEEGTEATKFTRAGGTYAEELALCQRYYWSTSDNGNYGGTGGMSIFALYGTNTNLQGSLTFPATTRTKNPTLVFRGRDGIAGFVERVGFTQREPVTSYVSTDVILSSVVSSSNLTVSESWRFHLDVDDEL